jgi:CheY-like chemotaxis protein
MKNLAKKKVLVVDDEPDIRDILTFEFELYDVIVTQACEAEEALKLIETQDFDLIVSDIRMPGGDGLTLIKGLKQGPKAHVPLIFVSGFADLSLSEAYDLGAEGVFQKPFEFEDLISAASRCLQKEQERFNNYNSKLNSNYVFRFKNWEEAINSGQINLGRGGFFLSHLPTQASELNQEVKFEINFEETKSVFRGTGRIRWSRKQVYQNLSVGMGLEIISLDDGSRNDFLRLVEAHNPKSFIPQSQKTAA